MNDLLGVILPVFLVIGFGYLAVWRGWMTDDWTAGLMKFSQGFAIPCLLFTAAATLDLQAELDPLLLIAFYSGSTFGFVSGSLAAYYIFKRPAEDAVVIGFACLFANSLLLGLPITERAFGADALAPNYAIIAFHAMFCYTLGITTMELIRSRSGERQSLAQTAGKVLKAIFSNSLMIAILLGFAVNLSGLAVPTAIQDSIDLVGRSALPTALFALGGTLFLYRPEGDARVIAMICVITLMVHPAIVWTLAHVFDLSTGQLRSGVVTAAMAPGVNAYIFANIYGRAKRVAASAVLIATALSVFSSAFWLYVLP
ncbi:AEC family transporter [Alphaproteobacteria bacterium KMM 3653]|uniref:AEC family transporter n=1 Tax=Harenicola maris TaxID=2841044 RepID=A0AAP2CTC2_9RHOB|nr:AEC family transporter [Harenicola maris]